MPHLSRDVRHALTTVVRDRKVSAIVILTMGLALGANAAIYGVVKAVLVRPYPTPRPIGWS